MQTTCIYLSGIFQDISCISIAMWKVKHSYFCAWSYFGKGIQNHAWSVLSSQRYSNTGHCHETALGSKYSVESSSNFNTATPTPNYKYRAWYPGQLWNSPHSMYSVYGFWTFSTAPWSTNTALGIVDKWSLEITYDIFQILNASPGASSCGISVFPWWGRTCHSDDSGTRCCCAIQSCDETERT